MRSAISAFLHRHKMLLAFWRGLYHPLLILLSILDERQKWNQKWKRIPREAREYITRETTRRARLPKLGQVDQVSRVAFVNDLGFLYGAGIAQKRQAASFLQAGWTVSIHA